jgi:hypothetical protein
MVVRQLKGKFFPSILPSKGYDQGQLHKGNIMPYIKSPLDKNASKSM